MRKRKTRDVAELRRFAENPLEYEVRIVLRHATEFLRLYPDGKLGLGLKSNVHDALLEAWLVHIRLLDDFLRHGQSHGGSAIARDWYDEWRSDGFLDKAHRAVLNDQLAHLSRNRKRWDLHERPPWDGQMRAWTTACCEELLRFFNEVPSDVAPAFDVPRSHVETWLTKGELG